MGSRRRRVGTGGPRAGHGRARDAEAGTHAGEHRGSRLAHGHRHAAYVAPGHRGGGGVETVDRTHLGVVVVVRGRRDHGPERVHGPGEALAAQGGGHLCRPVVVRAVRTVERVGVGERLRHETVQAGCAEAGFEIGSRRRRCVHRVAFSLAPFRSTIFKPYLEQKCNFSFFFSHASSEMEQQRIISFKSFVDRRKKRPHRDR